MGMGRGRENRGEERVRRGGGGNEKRRTDRELIGNVRRRINDQSLPNIGDEKGTNRK